MHWFDFCIPSTSKEGKHDRPFNLLVVKQEKKIIRQNKSKQTMGGSGI